MGARPPQTTTPPVPPPPTPGAARPSLRGRAQDIRALGRRVLERLLGEERKPLEYPKNSVLVSEDVTASMLAEVPPKRLAGVVSMRGSRTSHTAILARALGIPAVMGVTDLPLSKVHGRELIADGYSGRVYINPSKEIRREFRRLQREEAELTADLQALRNLPAGSPGGGGGGGQSRGPGPPGRRRPGRFSPGTVRMRSSAPRFGWPAAGQAIRTRRPAAPGPAASAPAAMKPVLAFYLGGWPDRA